MMYGSLQACPSAGRMVSAGRIWNNGYGRISAGGVEDLVSVCMGADGVLLDRQGRDHEAFRERPHLWGAAPPGVAGLEHHQATHLLGTLLFRLTSHTMLTVSQ